MKNRILSFFFAVFYCLIAVFPAFADDQHPANVFSDVPSTSWYAGAVSYASSSGFAAGSNGFFRPKDAVSRGEFVTMLASVLFPDGLPTDLPASPFSDVPDDKYYALPVAWASSVDIVAGTSPATFSPNAPIKREDVALILSKAEQLPELGELPDLVILNVFADQDAISEYAKAAVASLQRQGLFAGDPSGCFRPKKSLSRAEAVTVLAHLQMRKTGHAHDYAPAETVPATCTENGVQYYRCSCGSYYGAERTAFGHAYQSEKNSAAWTVTYTCSRCGASYTEALPGEKPRKIYDGNSRIPYSQALTLVDTLQQIYPDLISSYVGGSSVWGTGIRIVKLGKGNRYLFINGNLHGNETVTMNYLLKVLDEYAFAYATGGTIGGYSIRPLLDTFSIIMIPCSNPDGRARNLAGEDCKTNGRNVNLNANFPTNWVYAASGANGAFAGSEPETQTILGVLTSYPFELVLDCHTSGNVIYYADSGCSSVLLAESYRIAKALQAESGFGLYYYSPTAGLANFARHPYGVPGFTVEMYPYTDGVIDCTRFNEWCWSKLNTMPAIVMTALLK